MKLESMGILALALALALADQLPAVSLFHTHNELLFLISTCEFIFLFLNYLLTNLRRGYASRECRVREYPIMSPTMMVCQSICSFDSQARSVSWTI